MVFPKRWAKVQIIGRITKRTLFPKRKYPIFQEPDYCAQSGLEANSKCFNFKNATNRPGGLKT